MPPSTGTILIPRDIGAEWGRGQLNELTRKLALRLNQPVIACCPDDPATPFVESIRSLVNAGVNRLVVLPLGLLPMLREGRLGQSVVGATKEWASLSIHVAEPLNWLEWSGWLRMTADDVLNEQGIPPADATVLLIGQCDTSSIRNANLARLAHLIQEKSPFAFVSYALLDGVRPGPAEAFRTIANAGVTNVVVVPWLLTDAGVVRQLNFEVEQATQMHGINVTLTMPDLAHASLINILLANHCAALSDSLILSPQPETTSQEELELQELEQRINAMLPREYQGTYEEVRPVSMGTAGLKYDDDGKVAWDKIWTSFCDLALAGGPPHRGTLLEAVTSEAALAEPEQYQSVVAEIERAIRLVTSLQVVTSRTAGWVGVCCDSEEMAVWLMRAIIVENIMVRREGDVLFLPAGPRFTVQREIKNVVTAIAKTVHYWSAHLLARRLADER